jgi:hypothetical protein
VRGDGLLLLRIKRHRESLDYIRRENRKSLHSLRFGRDDKGKSRRFQGELRSEWQAHRKFPLPRGGGEAPVQQLLSLEAPSLQFDNHLWGFRKEPHADPQATGIPRKSGGESCGRCGLILQLGIA